MKNNFDRTKTATARFSTRAVAMMMFFVMLLTAIGSGSVLSAIAVTNPDNVDNDAAQGKTVAADEYAIAADEFDTEKTMLGVTSDDEDANEAIIRSKGDSELASTAAATGNRVKGSWDSWTEHNIDSTYTVNLTAGTYNFVFLDGNAKQFAKNNTTISKTTDDFDVVDSESSSITLNATVDGDYSFKFKGINGGGTSMRVTITFPTSAAEDVWRVTGSNTALFGTPKWSTGNDANIMTAANLAYTKYTWTKSNVYLSAGTIEYKVAKNNSWTGCVPASGNQTKTVAAANYYDVTVTFTKPGTLEMTLTESPRYTLTVDTNANAEVTATYGGQTVGEGSSISNIPKGANITVNVTPESGYRSNGISVSPSANVTRNGNSYSFAMPANDASVSATMEQITPHNIYFNNMYAGYSMVYVYAKNDSTEYISGTTMNKMDNSNIWWIEVPGQATTITFIGDGVSSGELTIPWDNTTYAPDKDHLMYTVYDKTHPELYVSGGTGTGTWGQYVNRNDYTVTDGSTLRDENLYTGIQASFYDYYVDHEITSGWMKGYTQKDYDNNGETANDPFKKLNGALSEYADKTTNPKNDTTYPLYFGNLNYEKTDDAVKDYYNFEKNVNNSNGLADDDHNAALTGLSGMTLEGGNVHYYKSGAQDSKGIETQNGAAMAMFDEDFLSGANKENKALATILHSSSFPVRKSDLKTIYYDATTLDTTVLPSNGKVYAHFWKSPTDSVDVDGAQSGKVFSFAVPDGYNNVLFYIGTKGTIGDTKTIDLEVPTDANVRYVPTAATAMAGAWAAPTKEKTTHTYYEYDSTNGRDNAFVTDIDTTNHTAQLNYYDQASGKTVISNEQSTKGFYPFDYNNIIAANPVYDVTKIYFNHNNDSTWYKNDERYAVYFYDDNVSPKQETWVDLTWDSSTSNFVCDIPTTPYDFRGKKCIICRMDGSKSENNWDNKWNQTADEDVPTTNSCLMKIGTGWTTISGVSFPVLSNNNFASPGDKKARDIGFGMKLEIPFTLNANGLNEDGSAQTFDFSGDDDLWVFIDNKLVLDLGGAHGRTTGHINFSTMQAIADDAQSVAGVTRNGSFSSVIDTTSGSFNPNTVHTMTIYYMERGMFESNLKFGFSFHAIDNDLQVEKKVRTKSTDEHQKINSGLFADNGLSDSASNMSNFYVEGKQKTVFEKSFQSDDFTITHSYNGDLEDGVTNPTYTMNGVDTQLNPSSKTLTYDIQNNSEGEHIAHFVGQFKKSNQFTLKETFNENNKYVYTPSLIVYDDANGSKEFEKADSITSSEAGKVTGDNTNGYKFNFLPTASGGLEVLNLRARFENQMKCHDLTIKKETSDGGAGDEEFTMEITFDFEGNGTYLSYPLFYTKSGVSGSNNQIDGNGQFTLKQNEVITFLGIPENAKVRIREIANDSSNYTYNGITVTAESGANVATTETDVVNGVNFRLGSENTNVVVNNSTGEPVLISHSLYDSVEGSALCYVQAKVLNDSNVKVAEYERTNGMISIPNTYINKNHTNYSIVITLTTEPNANFKLVDFLESITGTMKSLKQSGTPYTAVIDIPNNTATVTVSIGSLFNASNQQLYTELPFYSKTRAAGELKISHDLLSSCDTGSAVCELKVELLDSQNTPISLPEVSDYNSFTTNDITIGSDYIKDDSTNKLRITLKTTTKEFYEFVKFYEQVNSLTELARDEAKMINIVEFSNVTSADNKYTAQVVITTKEIRNFFDATTKAQLVSALPFYSKTVLPKYHYNITYIYDSYRDLYGEQSYTVDEDFTYPELMAYMRLTGKDLAFASDETGDYNKKTFISGHAPTEDNFKKTINYNNYELRKDRNYSTETHILTMTVKALGGEAAQALNVTFKFPYDVYTPPTTNPTTEELQKAFFSQDYLDNKQSVRGYTSVSKDPVQVQFMNWAVNYGRRNPNDTTIESDPVFIAAPLWIDNQDTHRTEYFQYWSVKRESEFGSAEVEYTRCYDYCFDLSIFTDCTVEPIYVPFEQWAQKEFSGRIKNYHDYEHFNPALTMKADNLGIGITFLEDSRNQYNNNGGNTRAQKLAGDVIYTDFVLNFNYAAGITTDESTEQEISKLRERNDVKCGLIIEAVQYMNKDNDGFISDVREYDDLTVTSAWSDELKSYIGGTGTYADSAKRPKGTIKYEFDSTELDNKNCIQYYCSLNNRSLASGADEDTPINEQLTNTNQNRYKVFRAYSYLYETQNGSCDGSSIKLSDPVYFTIYDLAKRDLADNATIN